MLRLSITSIFISLAFSPVLAERLCPNYDHPSSVCESKLNNVTVLHLQPHAGNEDASNGMISDLGEAHGFNVARHDDGSTEDMTPTRLAEFDLVVMNGGCFIGERLSTNEKLAFEEWYEAGGGFLAIHCACWPLDSWPWFQDLFGDNLQETYIAHENPNTEATVNLDEEGGDHEAAMKDGEVIGEMRKAEEYYVFGGTPRGLEGVEITYVMDPETRSAQGVNFNGVEEAEMSWFREYKGGRAYWTYWGHAPSIFQDEEMQAHWLGAMRMAAGYDIVGCMDNTSSTFDANATVSNPDACAAISVNNIARDGFALRFDEANLNVSVLNKGTHTLNILNTRGEVMLTKNGRGDTDYNFENKFERGIYIVKVETHGPQVQVHTQKFTVY